MKRWVCFFLCLIFGGALLVGGLLVPIHLRALDTRVLERAGKNSRGIVEQGFARLNEKNLSAAELLSQTAEQEKIPGHEKLRAAVEQISRSSASQKIQPFTAEIIQSGNRLKALADLRKSSSPVIQRLLRCRAVTNTVLFSPSQSSAGQAFDAAVSICGLLVDGQHLTRGLVENISSSSSAALRGESSQPLEQILLDFMSLGQRLNWGQLVAFSKNIENAETLRLLANLARKSNTELPILFSAVELSGKPAAVAKYRMNFSQTGEKDLATSLRFGAGGVNELLERNQRLYRSGTEGNLNVLSAAFVHLSWQTPRLALAVKWFLFLAAGYLLALALHFARPRTPVAERPFQARGFHIAREILFALGFLLVVLLLSEPFLAQESQSSEFPIRLHLPTAGSVVAAENVSAHGSIMNQLSLLTLLLFFVLQGLIYIACLFKLAEIRRQTFPSNVKLKLLENEEHLFDAGLYLGFAGTIISLILVSMGVIKPSLMAAYSSTSFGVIFVSIFKIFHLRPLRRKLLIETESAKTAAAPAANPFTAPL